MADLNGYILTKEWFDFALDNPDKVTSNHTALYLWLVEINNRCSWRDKFQITAKECMDGMSCRSRTTYTKCFHDLVDWDFVIVVIKSKNQYQCNVISLYRKYTSTSTSVDTSISQASIPSIDNHLDYSKTIKPLNNQTLKSSEDVSKRFITPSLNEIEDYMIESSNNLDWSFDKSKFESKKFFDFYESNNWKVGINKMVKWKSAVSNWINRAVEYEKEKSYAKKEKESQEPVRGVAAAMKFADVKMREDDDDNIPLANSHWHRPY